jgi:CHAT domain-containing protein/tetratricopeptide (TPR) repeat protein
VCRYWRCLPILVAALVGTSNIVPLQVAVTAQTAANRGTREQEPEPATELLPDKTIERELSPDHAHTYEISLVADQYARVEIEAWGQVLEVEVFGPNGQLRTSFGYYGSDAMPLSIVSDVSGYYKLVLRLQRDAIASEPYRLRVSEFRQRSPHDRNRMLAEITFAEATRLASEWLAESSDKALKKYDAARVLWAAVQDQRGEALALRDSGRIYESVDKNQNALICYDQALTFSEQINDLEGVREALNRIGYLYSIVGNNPQAREYGERALKSAKSSGDQRAEAQALHTIGDAYYGLGDLPLALKQYEQSLQLWRLLGDRSGQAQVEISFGYAYVNLSETQKASDSYHQALSLSRALRDRHLEALTLRALGNLLTKLGQHQQALEAFQEALDLAEKAEGQLLKARILAGIGYAYEGLGDPDKALAHDSQAIAIFQEIGNRWGEAELQMDSGRVYFSLGNARQALTSYTRAMSLFRELDMPRYQAQTLRDMGQAYASWGDNAKALDCYERSLSLTRAGQDQRYEAYTLNYIGSLYANTGREQEALDLFQQALTLNRVAADPAGESITLYNLARVERDIGKLTAAREHSDAALRIIESLRTNVAGQDLRSSYSASVHQQYELHIDILMRQHQQEPTKAFDILALEASERGRARSLLETLAEESADIRQGVDPTLLERERVLEIQLDAKANERVRLLSRNHKKEEGQALEEALRKLSTEYQEIEARIRAESPRYAALTQPIPLSGSEIQHLLTSDTLLLEYALGDERSFVWVVTPDSVRGFELPGRQRIEAAAKSLVAAVTERNRDVQNESQEQWRLRLARADTEFARASVELSKMLLEPVASLLGHERLLLVADGALQGVPFGALPTPGSDALAQPRKASTGTSVGKTNAETLRFLIEDHEIVSLPSASVLAVQRKELASRQPAPHAVAVLADPVFDPTDSRVRSSSQAEPRAPNRSKAASQNGAAKVPSGLGSDEASPLTLALRDLGTGLIPRSLPHSSDEAEAIIKVAPKGETLEAIGFKASRETAMSPELSKYRIIHFATHGVLDLEHPELSGVILSLVNEQGQPQDGFLRLHDIYNLNLPADLVVLSGCETGIGKPIKGEGLIALTRGFMYAGAARVVASLWKVDDAATAELMAQFYEEMFINKLTPAAALRQAQIKLSQKRNRQSPYFWAGFVLQGEWR